MNRFQTSNQPHENQPMGVSPGSTIPNQPHGVSRGFRIPYQPHGVSRGSRRVTTGANALRLIGMARCDIVEQGYDLSINRYKEVVHEEVNHRAPQAILDELESIEKEITQGMKQLRGMLND